MRSRGENGMLASQKMMKSIVMRGVSHILFSEHVPKLIHRKSLPLG